MLTIGALHRKWTAFLLLCSIPTSAPVHATNETANVESGATAYPNSTTRHVPTVYPQALSFTRSYSDQETSCPYRTINYITHTLPQQCLTTSWSAPGQASTNKSAVEPSETPSLDSPSPGAGEGTESSIVEERGSVAATTTTTTTTLPAEETGSVGSATGSSAESEVELETDSPFDNANFLSFEEWKKRNLARAGQSLENVGQGRAASSEEGPRRRPVNVNALDSLGEEAEIEIDFSGFGTPAEGEHIRSNIRSGTQGVGATKATEEEGNAAPSVWALSKDAGKTCKERFNYASFDCAATVLKTNKQAKSSSSVLVESKDRYMLNECSADNKFIIVELCDDILVDTVVLANYEFFSSMFRHFRVSVSDRYPVKMDRWRTLATFEARNSRDIQPFLVTEPQIWARYLRIEFLTHFGNEFYCPLSLLRVHGTTMLEQFRREEEEARGLDDEVELSEIAEGDYVKPISINGPLPPDQVSVVLEKEASVIPDKVASTIASEETSPTSVPTGSAHIESQSETSEGAPMDTTAATPPSRSTDVRKTDGSSAVSPSLSPSTTASSDDWEEARIAQKNKSTTASSSKEEENVPLSQGYGTISDASKITSTAISSQNHNAASPVINDTISASSSSSPIKVASNSTVASPQVQSQPRASSTQPGPPAPTTQESFFKSIHKRLLYLEANSTLSLQYIEEQSRILRDAFVKVEKRQLAKTEKFLEHLNSTVSHELKSYRALYEQLWQSTVLELESMKERQKTEVGEIGTRLSLMADELVWQKRMAVVQSTLLLLCLGLVLFARSGAPNSAAGMPVAQQLGNKYTTFFESPSPTSPRGSGAAWRRRTFRSMWRSDTSGGLSERNDGGDVLSDAETESVRSPVQIEFSPPTPSTPGSLKGRPRVQMKGVVDSTQKLNQGMVPQTPETRLKDQAKRIQVLETQSGPATPNGTRDCRPSWEEVDRAIDQLKAKERGQASPKEMKKEKKKKKSPLRRAHSSYAGQMDVSPVDTTGK